MIHILLHSRYVPKSELWTQHNVVREVMDRHSELLDTQQLPVKAISSIFK